MYITIIAAIIIAEADYFYPAVKNIQVAASEYAVSNIQLGSTIIFDVE